jgi:hypothetical protein
MLSPRQVREAMELCASAVERFHASGAGDRQSEILFAEFQVVAAWTVEMGLDLARVEDLILRPLEAALFARYGHEVTPRIFARCLRAFDELYTEASACSEQIPV